MARGLDALALVLTDKISSARTEPSNTALNRPPNNYSFNTNTAWHHWYRVMGGGVQRDTNEWETVTRRRVRINNDKMKIRGQLVFRLGNSNKVILRRIQRRGRTRQYNARVRIFPDPSRTIMLLLYNIV